MKKFTRQYSVAMALTLAAAATGIIIGALPAQAAVVANIDIPDTVVCNDDRQPGNPPAGACDFQIGADTTMVVASVTIDPAWAGSSCDVTHRGANGPSTHPGTNLHVRSENTVTAFDVERASGVSTDATGTLTINAVATVVVVIELGPDGVWSGNGNTIIDCTPQQVTTTTQATTTTTEANTTTTGGSTTTTAPETTTTTSGPATSIATTSTTVPPVTTTTPDGGTLPFTADYSREQAGVAAALVASGALALYMLRSRGGRHEA